MAFKFPTNLPYVENVCVAYKIDPAAVAGIEGQRGVVLTAPSSGTNKACIDYPSAGTDIAIGVTAAGCPEPVSGDFPGAIENHVTVVHSDTYPIEVAALETINVGEQIALDAEGKAVAFGSGVIDTTWVAKDESLGTSTVAAPDYIRVILSTS